MDAATFRAISALLLVVPETPLLFQGQEWATTVPFLFFTDHGEDLGRSITSGRREEFASFAAFADGLIACWDAKFHFRFWRPVTAIRAGESDGNSATTHTSNSTTWTTANSGTGATAQYIATGEDGIHVTAFGRVVNSGANTSRLGIGDNSSTTCAAASIHVGTTAGNVSCTYAATPATGLRSITLLVSVSGGTATYTVDDARNGSATDPVLTALYARISA